MEKVPVLFDFMPGRILQPRDHDFRSAPDLMTIKARGRSGIFSIQALGAASPLYRRCSIVPGSRRPWLPILLATWGGAACVPAQPPSVSLDGRSGVVAMRSGRLELTIETRAGLNPRRLRDSLTGRVYADLGYSWPAGQFPLLAAEPALADGIGGVSSVVFRANLRDLEIVQTFTSSAAEPGTIVETVELRNPSDQPLDTSTFACGFEKRLSDAAGFDPDVAAARFCNVPYRRHPETGELCDYSAEELLTKTSWYSTARSPIYNRRTSPIWGAEAWAWYLAGSTFLVSKYNSDAMEWSLLVPERKADGITLRFGGAGRWKLGDPERAAHLGPHGSFRFGETRYQVLDGDWRQAYARFRSLTESKGNRTPDHYNPPVHWNELYDNLLWGGKDGDQGDTPGNRQAHYRREDMAVEAEKAREIGCECLYLDPGWDTEFGSTIWASDRLGTEASFARWLKETYGLALALHTPLAPWNKSGTYPIGARRMNEDGSRAYDATGNISDLCLASEAYLDTKVARLKALCGQGAYFLMFDGSWFPGPCWDPAHGHAVPLTRQEHLDAILRIQQRVHQSYPNVVIEQHDPMLGPGTPRYVPTYFMHDKPGAFDELWGNEYMIEPLDDILSHRAFSLYYLNLAYSIPVYLHIRLNRDNANAVMFWWYASTCRHLGMGAKPADPAVWEAQKKAMRQYLALKRFYTQGTFYGLDETVHAHTLADIGECVIDCFNLDAQATNRRLVFRHSQIGLPRIKIRADGARLQDDGDEITLQVDLPAMAHRLVQVGPAEPPEHR
jgi:hypothetical protein